MSSFGRTNGETFLNKIVKIFVPIFIGTSCCFAIFSQAKKATLVITNANIHTVDSLKPKAEAIAIANNKIIAVGKSEEISKLIGANTKVIDAKGKLVLPGFNDSHVHFMGIGNRFSSIDLRGTISIRQAVERILYYTNFLPKGRWILGGQWNHNNWTPNDLPTKDLLDDVTPDHPVFLYSSDSKMVLANSLALKIAGIDKNKKDPVGGTIVRYRNGKPTGLLKDNAIDLVRVFVPKYHSKNLLEVAETATNYAASLGVTSVQNMHSDNLLETLGKLRRAGKLKTRVYDCTPLLDWKKLAKKGVRRAYGDPMIRIGCLKYFSDGSRDAIPVLTDDIAGADKANLQVMMHAIGNRANEAVLTIYENVIEKNGDKDRRFRIEHAHNIRSRDLERFGRSKTIASMQPHLFFGGEPYHSLLNKNARIAFGSDASITDLNPLYGIYSAVIRGTRNETISVEEAVRLYTLGSAYAEFQENVKGSLSVGKLADLIILSDDIFTIDSRRIRDAKVLLTIMNGDVVYKHSDFHLP